MQIFRPEATRQRRAAEQSHQRAFLVGEVDGLQVGLELKPRTFDGPQHLEGGHHPEGAVEAAPVRDRVEVGAEQEGGRMAIPTVKKRRVIPRAVRAEFKAGALDLPAEPAPGRKVRLAECRTVNPAVPSGPDGGQLVEGGLHSVGIDVEVGLHRMPFYRHFGDHSTYSRGEP